MTTGHGRADVLIAGGGPVGLTLAVALARGTGGAIVLVDERGRGGRDDGRASAVSAAARRMLEQLGIWAAVADAAQPVTDMIVTDSRLDDLVRPVFLSFDGVLDDGSPFAHMVPNGPLGEALFDAAEAAGVRVIAPGTVRDSSIGDGAAAIVLGDGEEINATLLVAADGVRSRLRERAGIRTVEQDYGQTAIAATLVHERPHNGRAEEHFLPGGPFATLPLPGNRSSLVWTELTAEADRLLALDDDAFMAELMKRLGWHLGAVTVEGRRHAYPLALRLARDFVRPRFALVGDAAHSIHPLAGQGLNLGLRDVAALAETLVDAARLGLDLGALDVLERYQAWRRFDTAEMGTVTDGLNCLFSNDRAVVRAIRDVGLGLVDRVPFLKRMMIDQAAGLGAGAPRLLRGEAL